MPLWIKEDLTISHIHPRSTLKIMHSKIIVIPLRLQDLKPTIVSFEERQRLFLVVHLAFCDRLHGVMGVLQFFESGEDGSGAWVGECLAVSLGELPFQGGC
jgi:hypothetical protein